MNKRFPYFSAVLILLVLVSLIIFSGQDKAQSAQVSRGVTLFLRRLVTPLGLEKYVTDHLVRKMAHFALFALLGIGLTGLVCWAVPTQSKRLILVLAFSIAAALLDEGHQLFSPGRSGQFSDVLLDTAGAVFGSLARQLISYLERVKNKTQT